MFSAAYEGHRYLAVELWANSEALQEMKKDHHPKHFRKKFQLMKLLNLSVVNRIRKKINFGCGKEIEKDIFPCYKRGTKSPHEEWTVRPLDSADFLHGRSRGDKLRSKTFNEHLSPVPQ